MKTIIIVYLSIFCAVAYGWILNIVSLLHAPGITAWDGTEILRCVGIFVFPLGSIMGYFV